MRQTTFTSVSFNPHPNNPFINYYRNNTNPLSPAISPRPDLIHTPSQPLIYRASPHTRMGKLKARGHGQRSASATPHRARQIWKDVIDLTDDSGPGPGPSSAPLSKPTPLSPAFNLKRNANRNLIPVPQDRKVLPAFVSQQLALARNRAQIRPSFSSTIDADEDSDSSDDDQDSRDDTPTPTHVEGKVKAKGKGKEKEKRKKKAKEDKKTDSRKGRPKADRGEDGRKRQPSAGPSKKSKAKETPQRREEAHRAQEDSKKKRKDKEIKQETKETQGMCE